MDRQKASSKLQKAMDSLRHVKLTPEQQRKFELLRACERESRSKYCRHHQITGPDIYGNYDLLKRDEGYVAVAG